MTEATWPQGVALDGIHCQLLSEVLRRDTARFDCVAYDDDYFGKWRLLVHKKPHVTGADVQRAISEAAAAASAALDGIERQTLVLFSDAGEAAAC